MPHIRIVGWQQEAWANARKSDRRASVDTEARWRESLVDVGPRRGRVEQKSMRLSSSNLDCVLLERWCAWFRAQRALMQTSGAATVLLDTVDFSDNAIGDRGLSILVDLLLELSPKVLRLFRNNISDAAPIEKLLTNGCLHELHLSNNKMSIAIAVRLVVAAARAEDGRGAYRFPIRGVKPLWLRVENQDPTWPLDSFAGQLFPELCEAERPRAACFVDGRTDCKPTLCKCTGGPRAVHLLHVGSSDLNSLRGMRRLIAGRGDQSRGSCTRHHVEWRAASPKREKLPPAIAPWCNAASALPQAARDLSEFPPSLGVEVLAVGGDSGETHDEEDDGFPALSPCYILPRWGGSESPCMTLGVCAQETVDVRSVHV